MSNKAPLHNRKYLKKNRKALRHHLTPAEAFLWEQLKHKKFCNRKFRRQHSIANFIVDFYCPRENLIIELDGNVHLNPKAESKDRQREKILEDLGFTLLRFENKMVFQNLPSVLREIRDNFENF